MEERVIKFSEEEVSKIKEHQEKTESLIRELGQLSLEELNLKERHTAAANFLADLKEAELLLGKELQLKYGKGSINIETGIFTPLA